jgi:hypothetical protein
MPAEKDSMISHEHKCVFVHQRKCAGTSIMKSFGYTPDDNNWHYMNNGVLCREFHDRPLDYLVFSVVRNPWDRFISGWLYCKNTRYRSLRQVLQHLPQTDHDYEHITRLQSDILFEGCGNLITHNLLKFEHLQQDWDVLSSLIAKEPTTLPVENKTPLKTKHYREYFESAVDRDLFLRHFAKDVDTFEYEF